MTRRPLSMGIMGVVAIVMTMAAMPGAVDAQHYGGGPGYRRDGGPGPGPGPGRYRGDDGYPGDGYRGRGRGYRGGRDGYGRRHGCRDSGTGGTIIGAIAGGLLGNSIAGYGDRAAGTIVGGGLGALAGRAIDRDC